ncbi:MAG: OmpH family outer membrane protein [Bacteroidetes bacterium]|nr:OmpH family outer membrane protein [Bacteroidota bacterium]NCQ11057.1 OmpH family outer membrane protein [Bacteroidota bacterium]
MLKSSFFSIILVIATTVSLKAQQKIGYIDSDFILSKIPEYSNINERLNILSQQWKKELSELEEEVASLDKEYESKSILYTEEIKNQRLKEIEAKRQKIDQFRNAKYGPSGEYFKRQQEFIEPLQQRILEAVNKIAEREKYDFIFDRTGDYLFLFTNQQWNLSEDVLLELGIELEESGN